MAKNKQSLGQFGFVVLPELILIVVLIIVVAAAAVAVNKSQGQQAELTSQQLASNAAKLETSSSLAAKERSKKATPTPTPSSTPTPKPTPTPSPSPTQVHPQMITPTPTPVVTIVHPTTSNCSKGEFTVYASNTSGTPVYQGYATNDPIIQRVPYGTSMLVACEANREPWATYDVSPWGQVLYSDLSLVKP